MKKILLVTGLIVASVLAPASFAQQDYGANRLINQAQRAQNQASQTAQRQATQLDNLKKRADKAIDERVNHLNKLLTRIQNDQKLSADTKSSLAGNIQTSINGLTTLKAKIDADTDITVARADAQNIVTNFRIYVVFIPKMQLLVVIDNLQAQTTKLQSLTPKLQDLINNLKSQGKDTSKLQPLLDDMNSKLAAISSQLSADKSKVVGVSISDVNGAHATFVSVRQDLANVRSEFAQIGHDVGQMREQFRVVLHGQGSTSSTSASPR